MSEPGRQSMNDGNERDHDEDHGAAPVEEDEPGPLEPRPPPKTSLAPLREHVPVLENMARAARAATPTNARVVRFVLGVPVGILLSVFACAIVTLVYPLTVPMSLFLTMALTMATGLLFSVGFPTKDAFTSKELLELERAELLFRHRMKALDERQEQLRANGMTGPAIEAELGPERRQALESRQRAIEAVEGNLPHTSTALRRREPARGGKSLVRDSEG